MNARRRTDQPWHGVTDSRLSTAAREHERGMPNERTRSGPLALHSPARATPMLPMNADMAAKKKAPARQAAKKSVAKPRTAKNTAPSKDVAVKKPRVFGISFASIYPLYVQKAENKGRTKAEVDEVIAWLTGYSGKTLQQAIEAKVDLETFFAQAPRMNPNAGLITGVVCGVRVEEVADPLMQKIRYLDKLVDELARGKKMASILRH